MCFVVGSVVITAIMLSHNNQLFLCVLLGIDVTSISSICQMEFENCPSK
jgi:hypothetical protein